MPTVLPDKATLRAALESAVRAPSIYNSQPWRWRAGPTTGVDLFADPVRHLIAVDPDGRDLLLSCGAALHHLCVALGDLGWSARIDRLPDPEESRLLAHVQPQSARPSAEASRLAGAIGLRRTDRRRFSAQPVEEALLRALVDQAAAHEATLYIASGTGARERLIELLTLSGSLQRQQAGYAAELARWAGRYAHSGDGIAAGSVPGGIDNPGEVPMRAFPNTGLAQSPHSFEHQDASVLMVLASVSDDRPAVLRAGEATSAVLLAATDLGLATTILSQPLEVAQTRASISSDILGSELSAQLVLRVGWAQPGAPELPPAPRRRLQDVVEWNR
ncbi:MAG: NAD(P)H nitroreductase [Actinomycetota bacterium]|nr:NAD(P)H nitroreductase [Actinomycetota bacterium]